MLREILNRIKAIFSSEPVQELVGELVEEVVEEVVDAVVEVSLAEIKGVGQKTLEVLVANGFYNQSDVAKVKESDFVGLSGLSENMSKKIYASVISAIKE